MPREHAGKLASTRRIELIIVLGALTAFGALSIDMYLPALPSIARDFHVPIGSAEHTLASFFLGFAAGQAFFGPMADRFGRKPPLYAGLLLYLAMCAACALSSSVEMLMAARFFQAVGACAGGVVARACVRDLFGPEETPRIFAYMMLVLGVAPLIAPFLGGYFLIWASWRAIFWFQFAFGGAVALAVAIRLPETHGGAHRALHPFAIIADYARIFRDRRFIAYALSASVSNASLYAYLTGSAHVFIDIFHIAPQNFGWFFAANAAGLIGTAQIAARLVHGRLPEAIMLRGQFAHVVAGVLLVAISLTGIGGVYGVGASLFVFLSFNGAINPMGTGAAMRHYGVNAGMASALLGSLNFAIGFGVSLVMGAFNATTPLPLAAVMAGCALTGLLLHILLRPQDAAKP
ncbi:MAG: multidrug effflux MFS transporter [Proteobacteria bacterium]|nr:multidrug effflux MFS transporter [Pseudomonadota bacterium]